MQSPGCASRTLSTRGSVGGGKPANSKPNTTHAEPATQVRSCTNGLGPTTCKAPASSRKSAARMHAEGGKLLETEVAFGPRLTATEDSTAGVPPHQQSRYWPPPAVTVVLPQVAEVPEARTISTEPN